MKTVSLKRPSPPETLIRRPVGEGASREFVEDVTLFSVALSGDAERILLGLESGCAEGAVAAARQWRKVAPGERHRALAQRFGAGPTSAVRLQRLFELAGPGLKRAVVPLLPAWLRNVGDGVPVSDTSPTSLQRIFAERLLKEALQPPPSRGRTGPSSGLDAASRQHQ
jgi:hypothetical protein